MNKYEKAGTKISPRVFHLLHHHHLRVVPDPLDRWWMGLDLKRKKKKIFKNGKMRSSHCQIFPQH